MGSVRVCAAPGCGRVLNERNKSGVCANHSHSQWCACTQCASHTRAPRAVATGPLMRNIHPQLVDIGPPPVDTVPSLPPHLRTVEVAEVMTGTNGIRFNRITLPREPWEGAA